jgi:uncharacterized protein YyaL (SSP411 family)
VPNRLANETSPYLLQHADNPVEWYPWGEEALSRAREENRPILLSIGYSACHWCHVMERESFQDPETARFMNEGFVNIKVDREERPDIDSIYMRAVQAMTGHGGWPLTAFLTPEGAPFYGGTYFPPSPRHGIPSFRQVLEAARSAYASRRDAVRSAAGRMTALLERSMAERPDGIPVAVPEIPGAQLPDAVFTLASAQFDREHGGFAGAPKFPQPVFLDFLLRYYDRTGRDEALELTTLTLRRMARGGIYDHLGGGFHRYSVDASWLVPHFEKMLYDNALLARLYANAHQLTGDPGFRRTSEGVLDYLLTDLRDPGGGFYSARDADSEGVEGQFYLWSPSEVEELLPPEEARLFRRCYDVNLGGNFEGRSILHLPHEVEAVARSEGMDLEDLEGVLDKSREVLREARSRRIPPLRDEKIIASWNGLTIRALAEAGGALARESYIGVARGAAGFVLDQLRRDHRLLRSVKDGVARIPGFLEDYASVGNALLTLHEATLEPCWLDEAVWMADRILESFWSEETSTLYDTPEDGEPLLVRPRDVADSATPSGNSLAIELLVRLARVLDSSRYREVGERALASERASMERYPLAFGRLLSVLEALLASPLEIAIIGDRSDPRTVELRKAALRPFIANRVLSGRDPAEPSAVSMSTPLLDARELVDGAPAAYVCREYACEAPVTRPHELARLLEPQATSS